MSLPSVTLSPEQQHALTSAFAGSFLGLIGTSILFGVNCSQIYDYFQRFHKTDRPLLKFLVSTVLVLDILHQIFITHTQYTYMISDYFDPEGWATPVWSSPAVTVITILIDQLVRLLFVWRLWQFSNNLVLITPLFLISLFILALGIFQFIATLSTGVTYAFSDAPWAVYAYFASLVTDDIGIALSLCFYLRRSRTGLQRTDSIITVMMIYSINTGLVTGAWALVTLITYRTVTSISMWSLLWVMITKIYVNALMANLNSRSILYYHADITGRATSSINLTTQIQDLGIQGTVQNPTVSLTRQGSKIEDRV